MAIKDEALTAFFNKNLRQKELAERLDEAFDITYGESVAEQSFWVCQAKKATAERFGFNKELILMYSKHPRADARLMTTLSKILSRPKITERVEKFIVLLIYEGETDALSYLLQQEIDRIIVPISAGDIQNPQKGSLFIRTKIAERLGYYDLFGMSSPVKHDRYFYGRSELVQEIINRSTVRQENSGLFGLRKTGKTSVLFAIQRRFEVTDVLSIYVDCQNPGVYGGRWWSVLQDIGKRIVEAYNSKINGEEIRWNERDHTDVSNELMANVKKIFLNQRVSRIVLLIDEIEYTTPDISNNLGKHWDIDFQQFWQTIRAISQETLGKMTFIIAGVNPVSIESPSFNQFPNPIFQMANSYYLKPMDRSSIRDMIRSTGKYLGLNFDEKCYDYLKETYGGHPYLIKLACSEVSKSKIRNSLDSKEIVLISDFDVISKMIESRISSPIRDILLSLVWWYPEEVITQARNGVLQAPTVLRMVPKGVPPVRRAVSTTVRMAASPSAAHMAR